MAHSYGVTETNFKYRWTAVHCETLYRIIEAEVCIQTEQ